MAAGAAEDTLAACMARKPKEAIIGQRMIAEEGCWRDQNHREPFESVPGARKYAIHKKIGNEGSSHV
jgi:hypothetical protein